jgi:hypothetical protein
MIIFIICHLSIYEYEYEIIKQSESMIREINIVGYEQTIEYLLIKYKIFSFSHLASLY